MNIPNNPNKPLSKRQRTHLKKLIEEYAQARTYEYFAADQLSHCDWEVSKANLEKAEKALFSYLDKLTEE